MKPAATPTLQQRIDAFADAVRVCQAKALQIEKDIQWNLDQLAQAEAEVLGKAHGWQGVTLSGLIPEGENAFAQGTSGKDPEEEGDENGEEHESDAPPQPKVPAPDPVKPIDEPPGDLKAPGEEPWHS